MKKTTFHIAKISGYLQMSLALLGFSEGELFSGRYVHISILVFGGKLAGF